MMGGNVFSGKTTLVYKFFGINEHPSCTVPTLEEEYDFYYEKNGKKHSFRILDRSDFYEIDWKPTIQESDAYIFVLDPYYRGECSDMDFVKELESLGKANAPRVVIVNNHRTQLLKEGKSESWNEQRIITKYYMERVKKELACPVYVSDARDPNDTLSNDAFHYLLQQIIEKKKL